MNTLVAIVVGIGFLVGIVLFFATHPIWALAVGVIIVIFVILGIFGGRAMKAEREKLASALAHAGWLLQKNLPAAVCRFQRTRGEKFRTDNEQIYLRGGERPLWFCPSGSEHWLVWRSKSEAPGALALRRRSGGGFNRGGKLIFLELRSFPKGCARVDAACELPAGGPIFFGTAVGERFKSLLPLDGDLEFEYQDGWCRLKLDVSKVPAARMQGLADAIEEGLASPNASGAKDYSVVVEEEQAIDTDKGGAMTVIKIGHFVARQDAAQAAASEERASLPDGLWHDLGSDPDLERTDAADPAQYAVMREKFFFSTAEFLQVPGDRPHALAIEAGGPGGTVSAFFLADGATSLYFSAGGGIIGAGEHDVIRKKVIAFVATLAQYTSLMRSSAAHPEPQPGRVFFTILTGSGALAAEDDAAALQEGSRPLSPLFLAGRDLMAEVRGLQAEMS